jgi:hypothetical protein
MIWLLALMAFIALVVLGFWLPILWIGALALLVLAAVYGWGLGRTSKLSRGDPDAGA